MKITCYTALLLLALLGQSAFAKSSLQTNICIKNTTSTSHLIRAGDVENYDWDGDSRPDKNFDIVTISPGETICRREEVNEKAVSGPIKFTFIIDGAPTGMVYNNVDYYKQNKYRWGSSAAINNTLRLHGEKTIWFQPNDWWVGYGCDSGTSCALFEIR